jgi:hypothetical protein
MTVAHDVNRQSALLDYRALSVHNNAEIAGQGIGHPWPVHGAHDA